MRKQGFIIAGIALMCLTVFAVTRYYRPPVVENAAVQKSEKDFSVTIGAGLTANADNKNAPLHRIDTPIRLKIIDINNIIGVVTLSDTLFIAALSIALILGIYMGIYVIKERMRKPKIYSPYEIAVKSLAEINPEKACSVAAFKEFYFEVSHIIRKYLRECLNLGGAELTTKEFLVKLAKTAIIPDNSKDGIKNLIARCDLVKFSGQAVDIGELKTHFDAAKKIIDEINTAITPKGDNK